MENPPPTFSEAFRFWLKLGFISFGGPAGQIAIMHGELVERRRWLRFRFEGGIREGAVDDDRARRAGTGLHRP